MGELNICKIFFVDSDLLSLQAWTEGNELQEELYARNKAAYQIPPLSLSWHYIATCLFFFLKERVLWKK